MRGAGSDGEFGVRQTAVQLDGVFQPDLVVVGDHDQRTAGDPAQIVVSKGGLVGMHHGQLGDDHVVVGDSVW